MNKPNEDNKRRKEPNKNFDMFDELELQIEDFNVDIFVDKNNERLYPIRLARQVFEYQGKIEYYKQGTIMTEIGIFGVYVDKKDTVLDLVLNGKTYSCNFKRELSLDELNTVTKILIKKINEDGN